MLRLILSSGNEALCSKFAAARNCRFFCERRRRKGDGTKTDIFDERAAASQEEYFRKKTARQLEMLRKQMLKEKDGDPKSHETDEDKKSKSDVTKSPAWPHLNLSEIDRTFILSRYVNYCQTLFSLFLRVLKRITVLYSRAVQIFLEYLNDCTEKSFDACDFPRNITFDYRYGWVLRKLKQLHLIYKISFTIKQNHHLNKTKMNKNEISSKISNFIT